MFQPNPTQFNSTIDELYVEHEQWTQNVGAKTIHAKRMPGKFRTLKWLASSSWLVFFLGPYLQYNDKQAVMFDMANRQYHFFEITLLPYDMWLLAAFLLFAAIFLAMMTAILGRVFCGYFCFQTVWTDAYTQVEQFFEGQPNKRHKLDAQPWSVDKIRIKLSKHIIWLIIAFVSGITWMLWFGSTWGEFFTGQDTFTAYVVIGSISLGVYIFAGFMREQTCLWVCPYARIQGVMADTSTIMPTYIEARGEPRARLKKGDENTQAGDCVDCNQCVSVCPTGVDIRMGQEYGCITCGLCIDACDSVMTKIGRKTGLIAYTSLNAIKYNKTPKVFYKRSRVIIYALVVILSLGSIGYGLGNLGAIKVNVLHDRQPLYAIMSDGSVRNKYQFKITNKTDKTAYIAIQTFSDIDNLGVKLPRQIVIEPYQIKDLYVYLNAKVTNVPNKRNEIKFILTNQDKQQTSYTSMFYAPDKK